MLHTRSRDTGTEFNTHFLLGFNFWAGERILGRDTSMYKD
jgi:hypothetical protein